MFKFLLSRFRRQASVPTEEQRLRWMRDPLSHPAIEAMCERQLGDLPFGR